MLRIPFPAGSEDPAATPEDLEFIATLVLAGWDTLRVLREKAEGKRENSALVRSPGRLAVVAHRDLDAHRPLAGVLLRDFRGDAGHAADDEDELAGRRLEAEVVENRGERAVDVQRQPLDALAGDPLDGGARR